MALLALFVLSVVIVGAVAIWFNPKSGKLNQWVLSFSGAYLFAYIFLHILPETYDHGTENIGVFILLGFLLQLILDFISKGIEHGHAHYHGGQFPMAIFVGLCIHSLMEGMPLLDDGHAHHTPYYANAFGIGILIHKIPITIVLAGLLQSYYSKTKALLFVIIFALTVPLGALLSHQIEGLFSNGANYHQTIMALLVGVLLHVSTTILYETDKGHKFNANKVLSILLGFAVAYVLMGAH